MKSLLLITSIFVSQYTFALTNQEAITETDTAMDTLNISKLQQLTTETADYAEAYANYRLGVAKNLIGDKNMAQQALSKAAATLEQLNTTQASAENYALLSAVYGMKIYIDNSLASTLGPKSGKALKQAVQLEPNNPRVKLVQAISNFYQPKQSIKFVNESLEYFEQSCSNICWGHSEAYIWRGLAKQQLGNMTEAQQDWKQALAVNPNNGWAKGLLGKY